MAEDNTRGKNNTSPSAQEDLSQRQWRTSVWKKDETGAYVVAPAEDGGGITETAVEAFAEEYGMSKEAARSTLEQYQSGEDPGQFASLGEAEKASLEAATEGGSLYDIAPTTTREKYGEPEVQTAKVAERKEAVEILTQAGVIDRSAISEGLVIRPEVFKSAATDERVRQSLYDLGISNEDVNAGIQFHKEHIQLPTGEYVRTSEWNELPEKYQSIAMQQGIMVAGEVLSSDVKEFEANHLQLPDGKWVAIEEWNKLPEKYQSIGIQKGYNAIVSEIQKVKDTLTDLRERGFASMRGEYPEGGAPFESYQTAPINLVDALRSGYDKNKLVDAFGDEVVANAEERLEAINTLEKYKTDAGYNLPLAIQEGVKPVTAILAGFKKEDVETAAETVETAARTSVAIPDYVQWQRVTGEIVSDDEFQRIVAEKPSERDYYRLAVPTARRKMIEGTATILFSPTRIALPEVKSEDVDALEWAVGGAQLAGWALPILPTKALPIVSGLGSGIFGANLARNWDKLSTPQKTLGVAGTLLYASPALVSIVRKAIPIAVRIPTSSGEVLIWRGYTAGGKPIIGVSGGKLTIGTKGVMRIPAEVIPEGYRPISKVETSLMGTKKAMADAGMSQEGIDRVVSTLEVGKHISGKKSPYLPKTAAPEEIKSLSARGVSEILRESTKPANKVEQIYGSTTIKTQLRPDLRWWRVPADIDIQTGLTADEAANFAQRLLAKLRKVEGKAQLRIPKGERALIQRFKDGEWHNAVDIHGMEPVTANAAERLEAISSISRATGDYTYGLRVSEPSVTITYPGIGKVKMMSLAESGKRKMDAILRWRGDKTVAPEAHRVKDIVDMYVIAQTFKGGAITDDLLRELARVWGLSADDLAKLSLQYPTRLGVFEFIPATGAEKLAKGSPTISINVPPYLMRSSPSVASALASPSPLASVASQSVALSVSPVSSLSPSISPSTIMPSIGAVSPGVISPVATYPSIGVSSSAAISPSISVPSPVISPSPVPSPSLSPSPTPSLSPTPSPSPSPVPSPSPEPIPSPSPSPSFSPSPTPSPSPSSVPTIKPTPSPPPPTGLVRMQTRSSMSQPIPDGSIAFALGKRKGVRGIMVSQWYYIPPPWTQRKPVSLSAPPMGAINIDSASPYDTIQVIGRSRRYNVPESVSIDIGITDAFITNYGTEITFGGKGTKTDVGTRIDSPTVGMSIPDSGELIPGTPINEGLNRYSSSRRKPKRKTKNSNDYLGTSLQGVKL